MHSVKDGQQWHAEQCRPSLCMCHQKGTHTSAVDQDYVILWAQVVDLRGKTQDTSQRPLLVTCHLQSSLVSRNQESLVDRILVALLALVTNHLRCLAVATQGQAALQAP